MKYAAFTVFLVAVALVGLSCDRPASKANASPKTSAKSKGGPDLGADIAVTDADGKLVIFSTTLSEAWTLVASGGGGPAWKPIRIDDGFASATDEGWLQRPSVVVGAEAGSAAVVVDRRNRLLVVPSFGKPMLLVRDTKGGPVFKYIEGKEDPADAHDAPWLVGPRAFVPSQKKAPEPPPDDSGDSN